MSKDDEDGADTHCCYEAKEGYYNQSYSPAVSPCQKGDRDGNTISFLLVRHMGFITICARVNAIAKALVALTWGTDPAAMLFDHRNWLLSSITGPAAKRLRNGAIRNPFNIFSKNFQ